MEVMHKRVAGLDVHKQTVVACVRVMAGRKPTRECRTFATTTEGLLALLDWLRASRVTHVAMGEVRGSIPFRAYHRDVVAFQRK